MARPRIFLSYRTTNSRTARLIAAWLEHNRLEVWFAEEQIELDQQFNLSAIRDTLERAVVSCSHFLLLTNVAYIASDWCCLEADSICRRTRKNRTPVLEIAVPPDDAVYERFRFLMEPGVTRVDLPEETIPDFETIEAAMRRQGWPLPEIMRGTVVPAGHPFGTTFGTSLFGAPFGIRVPLHGWRYADESPAVSRVSGDGTTLDIQEFRRSVPVAATAHMSFLAYGVSDEEPRPLFSDSTDREIREWAMTCVPARFSELMTAVNLHGIHLDSMWGRGQLGLTYTLKRPHPSLGRVAFRQYWCNIASPRPLFVEDMHPDVELKLTFAVYGGLRRLNALSPLFEFHMRVLETALAPTLESSPVAGGLETAVSPTELPEALRRDYVVFDGVPPADPLGVGYRIRQVVKWLTGYW